MKVDKIAEGLWRWTSPHPAWTPEADRPDGWPREVGSVYYESSGGIVLIDPLLPEDADDAGRFWEALDRDSARIGGSLTVLVGNDYHGRSADAVRERYEARGTRVDVVGAAAIERSVSCRLTATLESFRLPADVEAHAIPGFSTGETAFFLAGPRALVFADAMIGTKDGGIVPAPATWAPNTPEGQQSYAREFVPAIERLLALRPAYLIPSHNWGHSAFSSHSVRG